MRNMITKSSRPTAKVSGVEAILLPSVPAIQGVDVGGKRRTHVCETFPVEFDGE